MQANWGSLEVYEWLDNSSCHRPDTNSSGICEHLKPFHFEVNIECNGTSKMEFSRISVLNNDKYLDEGADQLQYSGHQAKNKYSRVFKLILVIMFLMEMLILLVTSIMILARTWRSSRKVRENGQLFTAPEGRARRRPKFSGHSSHGIEVINGDTLSHGVYIGSLPLRVVIDLFFWERTLLYPKN